MIEKILTLNLKKMKINNNEGKLIKLCFDFLNFIIINRMFALGIHAQYPNNNQYVQRNYITSDGKGINTIIFCNFI